MTMKVDIFVLLGLYRSQLFRFLTIIPAKMFGNRFTRKLTFVSENLQLAPYSTKYVNQLIFSYGMKFTFHKLVFDKRNRIVKPNVWKQTQFKLMSKVNH